MQNEHILNGVKPIERRLTIKDVKAIIKLGLVQGNLIPAFAGAFIAIMLSGRSFLSSIRTFNDADWHYTYYGRKLCSE